MLLLRLTRSKFSSSGKNQDVTDIRRHWNIWRETGSSSRLCHASHWFGDLCVLPELSFFIESPGSEEPHGYGMVSSVLPVPWLLLVYISLCPGAASPYCFNAHRDTYRRRPRRANTLDNPVVCIQLIRGRRDSIFFL